MTADPPVSAPTPEPGKPKLARRARLRYDGVRGGFVLLLPETAVLLAGPSAEILELCDGNRTVAELLGTLQARYPGADLEEDVRAFLLEARERRWLA